MTKAKTKPKAPRQKPGGQPRYRRAYVIRRIKDVRAVSATLPGVEAVAQTEAEALRLLALAMAAAVEEYPDEGLAVPHVERPLPEGAAVRFIEVDRV